MKTKYLLVYSLALLSFVITSGCKSHVKTASSENSVTSKEELIKRGSYLVSSIGCGDCHSPKINGPQGLVVIDSLKFSGFPGDRKLPQYDKKIVEQGWGLINFDFTANVGDWGVSFGANITSDPSGIGNWPVENFIRAMKQGNYKGIQGARSLLPPMPWQDFSNLTDDDVRAIHAFLITTRPVRNIVPVAIAP
jgi:hypothetical protein